VKLDEAVSFNGVCDKLRFCRRLQTNWSFPLH